jgi:ribosome-associated translation inhibitor RaiA
MEVSIRWNGIDRSPALETHIEKRAEFALGRHRGHLQKLTVRLEDVNGPRGGVDKQCQVSASGAFGTRVARASGQTFQAAATEALHRLQRNVAETLGRQQSVAAI